MQGWFRKPSLMYAPHGREPGMKRRGKKEAPGNLGNAASLSCSFSLLLIGCLCNFLSRPAFSAAQNKWLEESKFPTTSKFTSYHSNHRGDCPAAHFAWITHDHSWDLDGPAWIWGFPLVWSNLVHEWHRGVHTLLLDTHSCRFLQLCLILCDPMDYSPPGSTVYGILQARIWEWLACPSPGNLPHSGIEPASHVSCIGRQVLYNLCYVGSPGRSWKTLQKEPTTWSKFPSILLIGLTEAGLSSRVSLSRGQHFSYKTSSTSLQEISNPGIWAGGDVGTFLIVVFLQMEPALYTSRVIYSSLLLPVREFYIPIICPVTCNVFLEKESKLWTYDLL